jgi:hypothetical protein
LGHGVEFAEATCRDGEAGADARQKKFAYRRT